MTERAKYYHMLAEQRYQREIDHFTRLYNEMTPWQRFQLRAKIRWLQFRELIGTKERREAMKEWEPLPDLKATFTREPTSIEQAYWKYANKTRHWLLATIGECVWTWLLRIDRRLHRQKC